ncbi:glycosyltransferase family 4 protein [Pseudarthrobacter oxydans]|uniref:glycosyltransferase family 4 protein n=1 Tax=Pseudarthrobacter oxydans TaxID=1671 RepID=UPI0027D79D49|nr:glycosyltransferase family 4 protein [Pseudarthrobacter oxydans]
MYGADKILLEVLSSLPEEDLKSAAVWLPDDLPDGQHRLSSELDTRGIWNASSPVPVLRRKYLSPSGVWPLLVRLWKTSRMLKRTRPEVVYCTTSAMVICLVLARAVGVKRVVLHVQEIWSPREATVLGLLARGAHRILCISTATRDSLPVNLHARAEILLNAHSESEMERVSVPSNGGQLSFVVASRWNAWKGHGSLLSSWDEEECPGNLVILGGPPSMGIGIDVPRLVSGLKHNKCVSVIGEVDDISAHIDAADFLILPSDKPEPFGLVLLEAFARGRAVIASDAGGVLDVVTNGTDGWLFPIGNASDLATVLKSLDSAMAEEMGRNARLSYEEKFSIGAYRRRFRQLWDTIRTES